MWLVSVSVMLAVVQWASSAGGSPRLPTRRTPPRFGASAAPAEITIANTTAIDRTVRIRVVLNLVVIAVSSVNLPDSREAALAGPRSQAGAVVAAATRPLSTCSQSSTGRKVDGVMRSRDWGGEKRRSVDAPQAQALKFSCLTAARGPSGTRAGLCDG